MKDVRGDVVRRQLAADHNVHVSEVRSIYGFLVNGETTAEPIAQRVDDLFADPIKMFLRTSREHMTYGIMPREGQLRLSLMIC